MIDEPSFAEDPMLRSEEKEIIMRVDKSEPRLFVHSEIASVCKALHSRADFEETDRRTVDGNVVAIQGYLPLGVLKVKQKARQYGSFSNVVSPHD